MLALVRWTRAPCLWALPLPPACTRSRASAHAPARLRAASVPQRLALRLRAAPEERAAADNDDVTFQPLRKSRVKGRLEAKVKVITPAIDAALDSAPTAAGRAETSALLVLTAVFSAIILEGLLVASSGFMSDEWDGIVQARVLPIFTPTLGLFLLGSSAYGVWKAYGKQ